MDFTTARRSALERFAEASQWPFQTLGGIMTIFNGKLCYFPSRNCENISKPVLMETSKLKLFAYSSWYTFVYFFHLIFLTDRKSSRPLHQSWHTDWKLLLTFTALIQSDREKPAQPLHSKWSWSQIKKGVCENSCCSSLRCSLWLPRVTNNNSPHQ